MPKCDNNQKNKNKFITKIKHNMLPISKITTNNKNNKNINKNNN